MKSTELSWPSRYQCDVCFDYRAKDLGKVAQHKLQKHEVVTPSFKEYACQVPGCSFKTIKESNMEFHMRMLHSEETVAETTCQVWSPTQLYSVGILQSSISLQSVFTDTQVKGP